MANTRTSVAKEDKKFRDISYIEQNARDGVLFEAWTQQWGLKIYTWYSMDKIKFSFIDKGAKGKGKSFDVCVNTIKNFAFDFDTLKHEVLHDIRTPFDFVSVMKAEKEAGEKYPKRYKFITGANGEKSVGICNSTAGGYCINGQSVVGGNKVYANIPCSFYDIYAIVEAYETTYAGRREELKSLLGEGIAKREAKIQESKEKAEEDPESTVSSDIQEPASEASAPQEGEKNSQPASTDTKKPAIHVRTISGIMEMDNGDYTFEAVKDDETTIEVRVPKEIAEALNEKKQMFQKFVDKANSDGTDFSFTGKKKKTELGIEYIFEGFC